MAGKTKAADNTIMDMWSQSKEDKDAIDLNDSLGLLKANAEAHLIKAKQRRQEAAKSLRKAMSDARKTADFGAIAAAALEDKASDLELTEAFNTFETMFGEKPTIAQS